MLCLQNMVHVTNNMWYHGSQQTFIKRIYLKTFKYASCHKSCYTWSNNKKTNVFIKKLPANTGSKYYSSTYPFKLPPTIKNDHLLNYYYKNRLHKSLTNLSCSFTNSATSNCSSNDNTDYKKQNINWLTIPNILTLGRLAVSPYIGYLVLNEQFTWAFGFVFLAGLTDMADGWIARRFEGQASNIGSYIDPLADKVLISVLTLSLTVVNVIPIILCGLIISRDVLLVATSSHFHYKHLEPPKTVKKFFDFENSKVKMEPTSISKFNTFLQLGLVGISVAAPVFHYLDHPLLHTYWYLVGATTIISGLSYVVKDKSAYIIK